MREHPIYVDESIGKVIRLHQAIISRRLDYTSVLDELKDYASNLDAQFRLGHPVTTIEVSNYHPDFIGAKPDFILNSNMQLEDFQLVIAREYGFKNWKEVQIMENIPLNPIFEKCVDDLLSGDLDLIKSNLIKNPDLIHMRSSYGHRAGLIHYLGSNGVEIWRQVVPKNLVEILKLLIEFNVDLNMEANIYGSNNILALLTSSGHPWKAGVARKAIDVLREKG